MTARVQRWGNSLAVRIPKAVADELNLIENTNVDLELKDNSVTIRAVRRKKYSLDELLVGMTPDNVHEETVWGPSIGRESLP